MLKIFICEDDLGQLKHLEKIIKNYIMIEDYFMEFTLASTNPYEIISYLDSHENIRGVYFLDVDLKTEINGIQLGAKIREKDQDGKIIFVTTRAEMQHLTFQYRIEALDYIIKDQPEIMQHKIHECLKIADKHYRSTDKIEKDRIKLKINNQIKVFLLQDILFFETTAIPRKIKLHLFNEELEFYGVLNDIETLSDNFIRIHQSFIINKQNIKEINNKEKQITMINGEICYSSRRGLKILKKI
ncbi:LytR/AlgR family response regulator transcription factor [Vagococcus silagei]|uniref:Response regulator transcription factor n=1 Tax=Vagococcus silagei TaxID=2508885 RepID=A0A4S3B0Q3_9ENTE|nr:LytTR family DNA-binding domain-containing protein [Vagococcus silagei]THB60581.1 response regulator transcription factor [Vagococcus silagei]